MDKRFRTLAKAVLPRCWDALPAGGRLVANAVTVESEGVLGAARARLGGELTRLSVARAAPVTILSEPGPMEAVHIMVCRRLVALA